MKVCLTDLPDRTYLSHRADYDSRQGSSPGATNAVQSSARPPGEDPEVEPLRFLSLPEIIWFLRDCKRSVSVVGELRSLVSGRVYSPHRFDDDQVIGYIAREIHHGHLVVWKEKHSIPAYAPSAVPAARSEPSPPPAPGSARPVKRPRRPPAPPPTEAPVDATDYQAQAAVLKAAAQDGTPFCEECEKARRSQAA